MRIKRLQHVSIGIEAGREDEARWFYGEALGLREKPRPMGLKDRALIWYDIGEDEHEIHLLRTDPADFGTPRAADHLCIEVDDIAAMRVHLDDKHIPIRETSVIDNRPRFFVEDPFGNSIELVQVIGGFTPVDE
ncbi:MAG: VOC family protein [Chloroflexota bacterium]|nr:VOC family protein [Chloroflexota bacterium]